MRLRSLSSRGGKLLALWFLAAPPLAIAADERQLARDLQELEQRIEEEKKSWLEFKRQATSAEERAALIDAFPREELAGELLALAVEAKGTVLAARAWMDLYRLGCLLEDRALFTQSLERLLADHMAAPEIGALTLELVYGAPPWSVPAAQDGLRRILAASQDRSVQANALAELALLVGLDDGLGAAGRAEAEALLARIEQEYGASDFIGMSGKEFAAGARHEIEHLRVGMVAPDFEVGDQDNVRFKLSDYRGRVVLLDFWGFV